MRRMPLSADTAVKLAKHLNVPLEHLMHMPQHILIQKLAELAKAEQAENEADKAEEKAEGKIGNNEEK
ncbi:YycC family protein [Cohnella thailandensis]|uniref:YycC family protein n=1 Tax=Cohnella thailandensis TaxID=557557 RepID=A0A841SVP7_9BACL|nr:YycC family protein [Cohnella thailandensis]MBB6636363.1 YycC family protein [Cohnella thailandensis]MBP1973667.1 plasmid maintenance system antidote protein VapI [Cohnella thailandensis]